jgi:hypothetical protein
LGEGGKGAAQKKKKKSAELIVRSISQLQNVETTKSLYVSKIFLSSEKCKKLLPREKHCSRFITKLEKKKKKRTVGTSTGFQFVDVCVNSKNPKRVLGVNGNWRFLEPI